MQAARISLTDEGKEGHKGMKDAEEGETRCWVVLDRWVVD